MQITNELQRRAMEANATLADTTVEGLLMPTIADLSNGMHLRDNRREPLTEDYVAWLEAQAAEAVAARSAQLHQDIGA